MALQGDIPSSAQTTLLGLIDQLIRDTSKT